MLKDSADVAICGGGLAGLTLALQLRQRHPTLRISVFEPKRRPLPEACHKVGESTVEIGGHYFGGILGLDAYFRERHLEKNGLRFFCGDAHGPLEERSEMGPRESPRVPAYQIDRGRFENDLREMALKKGIDLREGWGVRSVELAEEGPHSLSVLPTREDASPQDFKARWVIDATGRRRMLVKQLGWEEPIDTQASSSWFRVAKRVDIASLVTSRESSEQANRWHERDVDQKRWLSTNHLCGDGYWVWIIPLSSGHTSIGIVAEDSRHDYTRFSNEQAARSWLTEHEPLLAKHIVGLRAEDFIAMKDYRYFAKHVFSDKRFACVGEAGVFVDPLYSPGSDMIGLSNTLTAELIADDLEGKLETETVEAFERFLFAWARLLERTLCRGSQVMARPETFAAKLYWDYFYYWALMCPYYFHRGYTLRGQEHAEFQEILERYAALNQRAQQTLQAWTRLAPAGAFERFVGLPAIATTLSDLHLALLEERTPEQAMQAMRESLQMGEELVWELFWRALRHVGKAAARELAEEVGVSSWPAAKTDRVVADELERNKRRKALSRPLRDMERSVGKNARTDGGPSLRELAAYAGVAIG